MNKRSKILKKAKWTEQDTTRFVKEYLDNPCLWSLDHPDYKNKAVKLKKYQELYSHFKNVVSGVDEIKNKIRILRTTYKQEENKVDSSSSYTPRLSWYALMKETFDSGKIKSFKKDSRVSKQTKELEITKNELDENNFFYVEEMSDHFEDVEDTEIFQEEYEDDYSQEHEDDDIVEEKQVLITSEFDEYEPPAKKLVTSQDVVHSLQKCQQEPYEYQESIRFSENPQKPANEDISDSTNYNKLFVMSLLGTLNSLSTEKVALAKIKIQQILFEIEFDK